MVKFMMFHYLGAVVSVENVAIFNLEGMNWWKSTCEVRFCSHIYTSIRGKTIFKKVASSHQNKNWIAYKTDAQPFQSCGESHERRVDLACLKSPPGPLYIHSVYCLCWLDIRMQKYNHNETGFLAANDLISFPHFSPTLNLEAVPNRSGHPSSAILSVPVRLPALFGLEMLNTHINLLNSRS